MSMQQTGAKAFHARQSPSPSIIKCKPFSSVPFPNTLSFSHFPSSFSQTIYTELGFDSRLKCSVNHNDTVVYPKPSEIPWNKELFNTVHLIGIVGVPVEFKLLSSGKALAWTRLGVRKSASDTTWINLTFWDELAHIAHQHVEKGHRIYVSGRLVADTVEDDGEKLVTYYKVVVQHMNFVESNFSSVSSYERETNSTIKDRKLGSHANNNVGSTQELWQAFFANPLDWWDNRRNKKNPKYPDFKHKDSGEALWVEGKYNPLWVKSQLAILDSRMESFHAHEASMPAGFLAADDFTSF